MSAPGSGRVRKVPRSSSVALNKRHQRKMSAPGLGRVRKTPRAGSVTFAKHQERSTRKRKPPMVRHNVAVAKFKSDETVVDSLSFEQICEFQTTLNAL